MESKIWDRSLQLQDTIRMSSSDTPIKTERELQREVQKGQRLQKK